MRRKYSTPVVKKIVFNYAKIVASSPENCKWGISYTHEGYGCQESPSSSSSPYARCGWIDREN